LLGLAAKQSPGSLRIRPNPITKRHNARKLRALLSLFDSLDSLWIRLLFRFIGAVFSFVLLTTLAKTVLAVAEAGNGAEAVKWAQKDLELRRNFATLAAMSWALYRTGEFSKALDLINESLASGVKDARLFHQAGIIHQAFSPNGKADSYLQMAAAINPHYENFHVHR